MSLSNIRRFRVRRDGIHETVDAIQSAGRHCHEVLVIWSGNIDGDGFNVTAVHIPEQSSYRTEEGLCVVVDGPSLHRLNVWLHTEKQIIGAQVHGHPGMAYHSETDDAYPVATLEGSLSIVLPDFGRDGIWAEGVAAYRLVGVGQWAELAGPLEKLIEVVDDAAC